MSSHPDVIQVYTCIDLGSDLMIAARDECNLLDTDSKASFKAFQPGKKCLEIIDSVKQQSLRKVKARSVIILLPGATAQYLQSPCIVISITKDGLPSTVTTRDGHAVTVDWEKGIAWEVFQDVRLAAVNKKGGTLLVLRL